MSSGRRKFTAGYRAETAHRVIDSGRSIAEVARELAVKEVSLGKWVRDERGRAEATRGTDLEPLSLAERFELQRLRKKVVELGSARAIRSVEHTQLQGAGCASIQAFRC